MGLTGAIVVVPFVALAVAIFLAWGQGVTLTDLLLAAVFYVVTGLGVTVGFHRLLTHSSFTARPGDPHSPYRYGTGLRGQLRGLAHAHLGWLSVNS